MSSSPDDFGRVRSLLKLKRYEQPPSRYFDTLSEDVLYRLRGPEGLRQQTLLTALGFRFGVKPVFFYGLGVLCCAAAFYGVVALLVKEPAVGNEIVRRFPPDPPTLDLVPSESQGFLRTGGQEADSPSTNLVLNPAGLTFPLDPLKLKPTPTNYRPR